MVRKYCAEMPKWVFWPVSSDFCAEIGWKSGNLSKNLTSTQVTQINRLPSGRRLRYVTAQKSGYSALPNHPRLPPPRNRQANRFLTTLTNVLFGARLSDMETAYKAFKREVLTGLRLRCVRFDFEPEITAKLLLAGYTIHEVPISYNPRTPEQGKKITWVDGVEAIYTLLRCRFLE